ncbi:agmatinase [Kiloniella laminariae]|uniref:Agmatinase n=1 Tax=Kiloniella laminariae TaxID=454162 RepID=A0ABT4LNT9_9PROT|nr:agmatinase [Kiloniella laminariae]MCZ4282789.1 agmatinase [Kiloniella laminariae]
MTEISGVNSAGDNAFTANSLYGTDVEPMYSGATSFMRRKYTRDLTEADVAISGIPYDCAVTGRSGTRLGPQAVRRASSNLSWAPHFPSGLDVFEVLAVADFGDLVMDPGEPMRVPEAIEEHARRILATDTAMLTLGGDHFITYPILKAHAEKHGQLALIQIDAHSDTWEEDQQRIDHGTMFYHAAKQGIIDPSASAQVGIRTHNDKTHGFNILHAPWVHENGPEAVVAEIRRIVGDRKAYLTFDIDCLDPAFAPGTGTPVTGGLTPHQALTILRGLEGLDIVGADVVEVSPSYDISDITALAGATMAFEMLYLMARRKQQKKG